MLERHVGIETDTIKLNAYSSTPAQLAAWIRAAKRALALAGMSGRPAAEEEKESLLSLRRGVYVKRPVKAGARCGAEDVYFAMPCGEGQLSSGQFKGGIVTLESARARSGALPRRSGDPSQSRAASSLHRHPHHQGDAQRGADRPQYRVRGGVLPSLRSRQVPAVGRYHHQLRQPDLLQEAGNSDSRAAASVALSQAEGRDLPGAARHPRGEHRGPEADAVARVIRCWSSRACGTSSGPIPGSSSRRSRRPTTTTIRSTRTRRSTGRPADERKTAVNHWGRYQI